VVYIREFFIKIIIFRTPQKVGNPIHKCKTGWIAFVRLTYKEESATEIAMVATEFFHLARLARLLHCLLQIELLITQFEQRDQFLVFIPAPMMQFFRPAMKIYIPHRIERPYWVAANRAWIA
jgi:hypothetical protein